MISLARTLPPLAARALLLLGACATLAQPSPRTTVASRAHDFGTVRQGETVSHAFILHDASALPLHVLGVELSLPGMKARFKREIAPGADGTLTVEWTTDAVEGPISAEADVHLDDPALPHVTLTLSANVQPPLEFQPRPAVFLSAWREEKQEARLSIANHEERPIQLTPRVPEGSHFVTRLDVVEAGRRFDLVVEPLPHLGAGRWDEELALDTDDPARPSIPVPVHLLVKPELFANPDTADLGDVALEALQSSAAASELTGVSIILRKRAGAFRVTAVSTDVPGLDVTVDPQGASEAFRLDARLVAERVKAGPLSGSIRVTTSVPDFPVVTIPVTGNVQ